MIDTIKGFITGDAGIVLIILGIVISIGFAKLRSAIKGTALESDLKELCEELVKATKDGKIDPKEGRAIGRAGIDSLKSLKALLSKKGD